MCAATGCTLRTKSASLLAWQTVLSLVVRAPRPRMACGWVVKEAFRMRGRGGLATTMEGISLPDYSLHRKQDMMTRTIPAMAGSGSGSPKKKVPTRVPTTGSMATMMAALEGDMYLRPSVYVT